MSTFWHETHPVARKPHACIECEGPIVPGQRYTRAFGIDDRPYTYTAHARCLEAIQEHLGSDANDGWTPGEVLSEFSAGRAVLALPPEQR